MHVPNGVSCMLLRPNLPAARQKITVSSSKAHGTGLKHHVCRLPPDTAFLRTLLTKQLGPADKVTSICTGDNGLRSATPGTQALCTACHGNIISLLQSCVIATSGLLTIFSIRAIPQKKARASFQLLPEGSGMPVSRSKKFSSHLDMNCRVCCDSYYRTSTCKIHTRKNSFGSTMQLLTLEIFQIYQLLQEEVSLSSIFTLNPHI